MDESGASSFCAARALLEAAVLEPELPHEVLGDGARPALHEGARALQQAILGRDDALQKTQGGEPQRAIAGEVGEALLGERERVRVAFAALLEPAHLIPHWPAPMRMMEEELEDAPRRGHVGRARLEESALEQGAPSPVHTDASQLPEQTARCQEIAHAFVVLDGLEQQGLIVRAVVQAPREDELAPCKVAPLLLHLCVLEPGLRRLWLQLRRAPIEHSRVPEALLSLGEVRELEVDSPVHHLWELGEALLHKRGEHAEALALVLLAAQHGAELLVQTTRVW
mmetsp:Transcript_15793/g.42466  ORF Transcript_15793/g.42466 Transcript_15793/m.42466 type:complete len:282 (+) Transcript_15793:1412-2257(+)